MATTKKQRYKIHLYSYFIFRRILMFYVCYKLIKQRYSTYKLHWKYDDSTTRGQNKINTHVFSNLYIFLNAILNL